MKKLIRITTVPMSFKDLLKGQLKYVNQYYKVIAISSNATELNKIRDIEGVETYSVEMTRQITPFADIKSVWKLYRIFKKEKPFIVHTHTPKAGTVGMLAAKLAGVPNRLHTIAGLPLLEAKGLKRKLLNLVEKATYACATKIYPNSFGLKKIIINQKFCKSSKLKVLANGSSNGIDIGFFDPDQVNKSKTKVLKDKLGIHKDDFVFIFVGRIVRDKGINELVSAFKRLNEKESNTKLLIVGGFEKHLDPILPSIEKEIEINQSIIPVGYQEDVRPYFSISNVLVFPSYREGFPNVVMQSGAMGINSIVSNINGCNEIIENEINGIVIPVKDSDSLFEKMSWLHSNQDENIKMSKKTRKIITDKYERKFVWDEILKEYNSLN